MIKKILIFILLDITSSLYAYPSRFARVIKLDDEKTIEKTVDFIYDTHRKMYRYGKLSEKDIPVRTDMFHRWIRLSPSEQELVATLNDVADNGQEQVDLIWEWNQFSKNIRYKLSFLSYMGKKLEEDFSANKNKKIRFVYGDTYRHINDSNFGDITRADIMKSLSSQRMSGFILYLDTIIAVMKNDLNNIKQKVNLKTSDKLQFYLNSFEKNLGNFLEQFNVTNKLVSEKSAGQWITSLKEEGGVLIDGELTSRRYLNFLSAWNSISLEIMNLDVLLRIFYTDAKHVIVCAGGHHCEQILKMLIESFSFQRVTDFGEEGALVNRDLIALDKFVWKYLKETPQESIKRAPYNKVMPKIIREQDIIGNYFFEALDDPNNKLESLEKLLKTASAAHVDLINMQKNDRSTMLHKAVRKNTLPLIDLLLKYGAETNISDKQGNTPIFYATSVGAIRELHNHHAKINIRNDSGQTPLYRAILTNNVNSTEALLQAGANPNEMILFENKEDLPLDVAIALKHNEIADLLKKYGANRHSN